MRPYLELIRLPAVFTAPADVLAGIALALAQVGSHARIDGLSVALLVVVSACVYCAGMATNDIFDARVDAQERPGRPIPSGRVSLAAAWMLVLGLQMVGLGLAALLSGPTLAATGLTIACTYAYNAALKDSLLGPLTMGACRYGNALIGLSILDWPSSASGWIWAVPATTALYVAALTFTSRHEVDGTTAATLRPLFGAMLITAALPAAWALTTLPITWAAAAIALPIVWLLGPMRHALKNPGAGPVRGVIMAGIFGIAMVNACLALAAGGWWQAAVALGLLVPGKAVGRWFYAT